jgi:hypothetical protein
MAHENAFSIVINAHLDELDEDIDKQGNGWFHSESWIHTNLVL